MFQIHGLDDLTNTHKVNWFLHMNNAIFVKTGSIFFQATPAEYESHT